MIPEIIPGLTATQTIWLYVIMLLWVLPWKGVALWKSAKNNQKAWFIVLLVVNTMALLEILYLGFFQKKPTTVKAAKTKKKK